MPLIAGDVLTVGCDVLSHAKQPEASVTASVA
jgi:hypothetical protein